jgi:hypothetical protein
VMLPFTVTQFFNVFDRYNLSVWPMQVVLIALAVAALVMVYVRGRATSAIVSAILAFLWTWMAVAYHFAQFSTINSAAYVFGILFLLQAVVFLWAGTFGSRLSFWQPSFGSHLAGWILIVYALVFYPILNGATGHAYWRSPTFGVPCPTTIFTFGVLWLARRPFPRYVLAVPIIWSVIGGSAAFILRVPQDLGLVAAGVAGVVQLFLMKRPEELGPSDILGPGHETHSPADSRTRETGSGERMHQEHPERGKRA